MGKNSGADDDEVMLNVLRCQLTYSRQVVTNAKAWINNSLRPRKPEHTAPELWEPTHKSFSHVYPFTPVPHGVKKVKQQHSLPLRTYT